VGTATILSDRAAKRHARDLARTHLGQELVETEDEVFVSPENRLHSLDDTLGVDPVFGKGDSEKSQRREREGVGERFRENAMGRFAPSARSATTVAAD
jgi:hypothetical protein